MSYFSWPFNSVYTVDENNLPVYDRAVDANKLAGILKNWLTNGVFMDTDDALQCVPYSNMVVHLKTGYAHVEGHTFANPESEIALTIAAAESNPRKDRIVLRCDPSYARAVTPMVLKGTAAITPVAPDIVRANGIYDISLAVIAVGANVTEIDTGDITDTRSNGSVCGAVTVPLGAMNTLVNAAIAAANAATTNAMNAVTNANWATDSALQSADDAEAAASTANGAAATANTAAANANAAAAIMQTALGGMTLAVNHTDGGLDITVPDLV